MLTIFRTSVSTWASVSSISHLHYHISFKIPHLHFIRGRNTRRVSTANNNIATVVSLVSDNSASCWVDNCLKAEKCLRLFLDKTNNMLIHNYLGPILHVLVL